MQEECGIQTSTINTCFNYLVLLGNNKKREGKQKSFSLLFIDFSLLIQYVLNITMQNPFYQMQVAIKLLLF